ncbi:MAG: hypothetical protein ACYC35_29935 [Pirellulales bacterium]
MADVSKTSGDSPLSDGARRYRPRRYYLYVGLIGTIFFVFMGVGSTCVAYWNVDGSFARPKLAALIFAVFWSMFTLLGIWLLLFYMRSRLIATTRFIERTGLFKTTRLAWDDVTGVKWRRVPQYGSIVLRAQGQKLVIELGEFLDHEREELVEITRRMVDREIHDGWQTFSERFIEQSPEKERRQRRLRVVLAMALCGFGVCFLYLWSAGLGVASPASGIAYLLLGVYLLWRAKAGKSLRPRQEKAIANDGEPRP